MQGSAASSRLMCVATCSLDQWALDFDGNLERINESIRVALEAKATYRVGPELEVSGYGCADHFLENDTFDHSWTQLVSIVERWRHADILLDIGAPISHRGVSYNCRVFAYLGQILLIRPKLSLANDGNYRETRWFTAWPTSRPLESFAFPSGPASTTSRGQSACPIGVALIQSRDTLLASEMCEELFTARSPHVALALQGVEIFSNGSGSHHELRKLDRRLNLILGATAKVGGVYLYANHQGCDGERVYYDGCASVALNGSILAQGKQFSIQDVQVVTAVVDLDAVRAYRAANRSFGVQAAEPHSPSIPSISIDVRLARVNPLTAHVTPKRAPVYNTPAQEIELGPACWLWDYLRRSRMSGFMLPLSGGLDSASTAVIAYSMAVLVHQSCHEGDARVLADVRRMVGDPAYLPPSAEELTSRLLHTAYLGTAHSSNETRERAARLALAIGSYHVTVNMDECVSSVGSLFVGATGLTPRFAVFGGTSGENLALQNVQARLRMVLTYQFAQLLPWVRQVHWSKGTAPPQVAIHSRFSYLTKPPGGSLLVLGSANVDECLRGYMTKYDCSSADINPIGGISKRDLRLFLRHAQARFDLPILAEFLDATPTAELEPITASHVQSDEADMGMTYNELSEYGRLRKVEGAGPLTMFRRLVDRWHRDSPTTTLDDGRPGEQPTATEYQHPVQHQVQHQGQRRSALAMAAASSFAASRRSSNGAAPSASLSALAPSPSSSTTSTWPSLSLSSSSSMLPVSAPSPAPSPHAVPHRSTATTPLLELQERREAEAHRRLTPREIAAKVQRFFYYYSINRHKMTTVTPAYHAEAYSPDDNRFDLRPFLYDASWALQFRTMNEEAIQMEKALRKRERNDDDDGNDERETAVMEDAAMDEEEAGAEKKRVKKE